MMRTYNALDNDVVQLLHDGGVGIIPTDTIYGIVANAHNTDAVERIYRLKNRNPKKPSVVLAAAPQDIARFGAKIPRQAQRYLSKPRTSVILETPKDEHGHIHRGKNSIAFRIPQNKFLQNLLRRTGPIIAPSANPEGQTPAETIKMAKAYFGDNVDFYVESGRIKRAPSKIYRFSKNKIERLR